MSEDKILAELIEAMVRLGKLVSHTNGEAGIATLVEIIMGNLDSHNCLKTLLEPDTKLSMAVYSFTRMEAEQAKIVYLQLSPLNLEKGLKRIIAYAQFVKWLNLPPLPTDVTH